jgi:nucleoside-diphosphate kinase
MEQTLSIIKPDAVEKDQIGNILSRLEKSGLKIVAAKMLQLTKSKAESFYEIHRGKPFFKDLTSFMSSGPILVLVLEGKNAVALNRKVMGATDPAKAEAGTIRKDFAESIDKNAVHGSDSLENAKKEISFFFEADEICSSQTPPPKKSRCCCCSK